MRYLRGGADAQAKAGAKHLALRKQALAVIEQASQDGIGQSLGHKCPYFAELCFDVRVGMLSHEKTVLKLCSTGKSLSKAKAPGSAESGCDPLK